MPTNLTAASGDGQVVLVCRSLRRRVRTMSTRHKQPAARVLTRSPRGHNAELYDTGVTTARPTTTMSEPSTAAPEPELHGGQCDSIRASADRPDRDRGQWAGRPCVDGAADATTYNVYRGTSAGGENATALVTSITTLTYTDTGVVKWDEVLLHCSGGELAGHERLLE